MLFKIQKATTSEALNRAVGIINKINAILLAKSPKQGFLKAFFSIKKRNFVA